MNHELLKNALAYIHEHENAFIYTDIINAQYTIETLTITYCIFNDRVMFFDAELINDFDFEYSDCETLVYDINDINDYVSELWEESR